MKRSVIKKIPRRSAHPQSPLQGMVKAEPLEAGEPLPLVVSPKFDEVELVAWTRANLEWIEDRLSAHGAILLRGFGVDSVEEFDRFVNTVTPETLNYIEGSSPRTMISDKIYTSTEFPPEHFISMHNELSYTHKWPSKIFFYCSQAPKQGGETPIADSRKVLEHIPAKVKERFARKQICYLRNLHGGKGAGLSWQTAFETDDKDAVEAYCREGGIELEWKDDGGLRTRQVRPAVVNHPKTGDEVWFNQAEHWHPSNFGREVAEDLLAASAPEDLPINATFGDDTLFDPGELDTIRAAFREVMVVFPWQEGDILLVDNTMVAHGRMPFSGPRKVLVAMGGQTTLQDVGKAT